MNSVKLSGRLTVDPELKQTTNGTAVCSFALAVDRRSKNDEADFPTVVLWKSTAEFASRYLQKGRKIIVEGELRTRNYDDKDGKKRKVTEVYADRIEFADSKPQENNEQDGPAPFDDDLPFGG